MNGQKLREVLATPKGIGASFQMTRGRVLVVQYLRTETSTKANGILIKWKVKVHTAGQV